MPIADCPLLSALRTGAPIGLLGIETPTRRRNRMNAHVLRVNADGFELRVEQSFGNCPQYIQTRDIRFLRDHKALMDRPPTVAFTMLDAAAKIAISSADTFFVSSCVQTPDKHTGEGVDVSHRGGKTGFVKVNGDTLTIPDYSGNNLFNTLGNFLENPRAGLIFPDFTTGDVLMLTGTVEILWEDHPEVLAFGGAERGWRFTLDHGIRIHDALPFRATFGEWSPNSLMTGDWAQAKARLAAEALRNTWQPMRVTKITDESSVIRSFTFEPLDGAPPLSYEAGQFLTIRVKRDYESKALVRTYTASSAPSDPYYRISVKREPDGVVSNCLLDALELGDVIEVKAPKGVFFIDTSEARPAILIAGGVGITPMISMARQVVHEGHRTRKMRSLTVFHAARNTTQRAFTKEFRDLEQRSQGNVRYFSFVSTQAADEKSGVDFDGVGHITAQALQQALPLADYDFFLCGPSAFMQAQYDNLRWLGVSDRRIFAESFGPAPLARTLDAGALSAPVPEEADTAVVSFAASGFEQPWSKGEATLLEFAEAHGLAPSFSCRKGSCGSCATRLLAGETVYRTAPTAEPADGEVLICCAVSAKDTELLSPDL